MDMDMDMVESHKWGAIRFPQIDIFIHFFTGIHFDMDAYT